MDVFPKAELQTLLQALQFMWSHFYRFLGAHVRPPSLESLFKATLCYLNPSLTDSTYRVMRPILDSPYWDWEPILANPQ